MNSNNDQNWNMLYSMTKCCVHAYRWGRKRQEKSGIEEFCHYFFLQMYRRGWKVMGKRGRHAINDILRSLFCSVGENLVQFSKRMKGKNQAYRYNCWSSPCFQIAVGNIIFISWQCWFATNGQQCMAEYRFWSYRISFHLWLPPKIASWAWSQQSFPSYDEYGASTLQSTYNGTDSDAQVRKNTLSNYVLSESTFTTAHHFCIHASSIAWVYHILSRWIFFLCVSWHIWGWRRQHKQRWIQPFFFYSGGVVS